MASRFQRKPLSSEKQRGIVKTKEKKFKTTEIFPKVFITPQPIFLDIVEPIIIQDLIEKETLEDDSQEIQNDIVQVQDLKSKNKKPHNKKENLNPSEKEDKNNSENI